MEDGDKWRCLYSHLFEVDVPCMFLSVNNDGWASSDMNGASGVMSRIPGQTQTNSFVVTTVHMSLDPV